MSRLFKRIILAILPLLCAPAASAQGWEANYGGVMLQGFYWDSFEDTKWTNLTSQSEELSAYFDLIWVPNSGASGYYSMGYMPQYWFMHESSFGTANELRNMINTYKEKGTGIIADVVINHRNGVTNWYDFPVETDHKGRTWELGLWAICGNDEMAYASGQPKPTGAYDEGENFDGCRDLDHTNTYVQDAIMAYLDYLLNELGYVGFRYDMTKGFAAYYVGLYNATVKPTYSVGEYYDGNYDLVTQWIDGTIRDNAIQSGSFDFPLKFKLNEAFAYPSDFTKLVANNQPNGLIKEPGFRRFSVTFVDNHDTYRDGGTLFNEYYTVAGNAFILCHPGTPCVFLPHWQEYKSEIKQLIDVRKSVGIHNQSVVEVWTAVQDKYVAKVYGTNGDLIIKVGYGDYTPDGFNDNDIVAAGEGYCVWSKVSITSGENNITPDNDRNGFSVYLKKSSVPVAWSDVYCYGWDNEENRLTTSFPGEKLTKVVTVGGEEYYKFSFDTATTAANVVFSNGESSQTEDITGIVGDTYYSIGAAGSSGKYTTSTLEVSGTETGEPITVYLDKSTVPDLWSGVKYYAWDANEQPLLEAWPGSDITTSVTVNGKDYYAYTFPETVTMVNILFTDGTRQTENIMGVTETSYWSIGEVISGKYGVEQQQVSDAQGISIYLEKNDVTEAWGDVYYYAWTADGTIITDTWPGTVVTATEVVNGVEYYKYTFDSTIDELNIIFTNGDEQTGDIEGVTQDAYYALTSTGGSVLQVDPDEYTGGATADPISIYVKKDSRSSIYYYAWDAGGTLLEAWPGTSVTATETVGGVEYFVYTFPEDCGSFNIIFNDGNGNQTADIENVTATSYYEVASDFTYKSGNLITVYLDKSSVTNAGWSKVNYYAWDSSDNALLGSWPGKQITETAVAANDKEYYRCNFVPFNGLNIIFNDGTSQTVDIENVASTTFYALSGGSGKSYTVSTVNTWMPTSIVNSTLLQPQCVIYPNPVTTDFVVRSDEEVVAVSVYDINGMLMYQVAGNVVNVRNLDSGIYLYRVELADGDVCRGRFIKR